MSLCEQGRRGRQAMGVSEACGEGAREMIPLNWGFKGIHSFRPVERVWWLFDAVQTRLKPEVALPQWLNYIISKK